MLLFTECWGCGKPLSDYCEQVDGVCSSCGLDTPLMGYEITFDGVAVNACHRTADSIVAQVSTLPPEEFPADPYLGFGLRDGEEYAHA